jgi:hypothetical protein
MMGQSETLSISQVIFITLFSAGGAHCAVPFTSHGELRKLLLSPNHFPQPSQQNVTFLHPNLLCRITY